MKIFVFGNPDISFDSLPLRILPKLRELYPDIDFETKDPNEEWELSSRRGLAETLTIIDAAIGLKDVTIFNDLKNFAKAPSVGMHDFDALANLRYLLKLGKIGGVTVIGLPPESPKFGEEEALEGIKRTAPLWKR